MTTETKFTPGPWVTDSTVREAARVSKAQARPEREKNVKPSVDWQDPGVTPDVPVGEYEAYWVAIKNGDDEFVGIRYYVNNPLQYADDDLDKEEPINDYYADSSGEPVSVVGWHDMLNNEYGEYQFLPISDDSKIIAWAEYVAPDFPNT